MAPSVIVALCLLALASAAPQNLQSLQCATSCDSTRQAIVGEIGKTYSFNYNVLSSVKLSGVNEGITQGGLTGTVDVSRNNPCELAIKFTSSNEADKVNKYPLVVSIFGDGQFEKACAHPEDDSESINIKKGIVSALQYSLPSFTPTKKQIISETSVLGTCPTAYSVVNKGENVVVNKEVTHSECHDHVYSQSKIPSLLSKSPMPLQVSNSVCTQVFSSNKVPQTITCKDTKVVRPTYGAYKYIEATQESTLQFVSESTGMSVLSSVQGSQLLSTKMILEHSMLAKNPALVGKLDAILSNVCKMVQGQGHQDTASIVNEAIELLEHIPDDAFVTILSKIRAGGYCADYTKLEALYMDAIAFIGEPGALKVIAQEVNAGRVTGGRTALYTAALHLLTKPTAKHVAALTPIAAMEEPTSTLILAVASVVNKHCKLVSECENTPAVKNILNLLTGKLVKQCQASFSNSNPITVIATLKTLGNIGYLAAEHAEEVIKCAKTEGVETNVRFAATMVLKAAPCKNTVKSSLLATVLDQGMNTEVRIGSYLAAIKCADAADLQEIVSKITADTNKQVHSFVLSHLHNLKETNWPLKAHLQKLLVTMNIPTNYARNIFKYSRNIEMSYDTPIVGVGAAVDSNVVFTPESYFPRLVNLGLDMNLLGSFVNIAEVGARVEGFDPIMKEVFGPESYLYKTPLSEIFKDSSLFIKQNGANLFNKLEQIIRKNESADIKSLIQSVFNFLKANNIKLPKTDLYAKLMGQEYAFLSVAGPMQEVNINHIIETMKSAVVDALVAAKDMNINTARAAHLHLDYAIPTIQGIPLKIKLVSTAVTGIQVQTKLDSKAGAHDALLKFIPSLSIAIDGVIGYGANLKHGLKMKNAIYSTNGLALFVSLKNGRDLELKVELPEKMELFNVKSEFYQVIANKLMDEEKIFPSNIKDVRIAKEQCFAIAEPLTGLNLCFKMNIPDIVNSNKLPLGMPAQFNIYLQKSEAEMKGYRVIAALKNKADKKVLKMVAGTYGSASSTESSVKLTYTKEANSYKTVTEVKSVWFTTKIEAGFIHQADLMTLQILANHKFKANAPFALACKFDVKKAAIAKGNEYQVTAFAGLTEALTETHKFLTVKMIHAQNGDFTNADLLVNVETAVLPITFGFGMEIPYNTPWFTVITKVELKAALGQTAIEGLVLRKMAGQYQNKLTIQHGAATVILLEATHTVTGKAFTSFNFNTEASAKLGNKEVGTTFTVKFENAVIDFIWELKNAGAKVLNINAKHSMESNAFATVLEVGLPTLPKTLKFSNTINVVEFLNFKITTDLHMDNMALLHIEGPVVLQLSKAMIKHSIDLKISGAFDGTIKVMNALLLSLEKTQFTLDMRHSTTPITMIDIIIDRTNAAETTAKALIHVPVLVKAEYAAVVTSDLLHTTMNIFILPTTSLARRFKGYADLNLVDKNLKTDFYWDAEKDTTKKVALTTGFKTDISLGKFLVHGDLTVTTFTYGYKLEALMASPFEWFLGTSGIELAVTAPSKKVLVAKALCTVEIAQSIFIFKPLMAVHTLDENKYEIAGSFAIKKLPAILNFEISSECTFNIPQLQKITVATKFLHEDKNGACAIVFKTGITGLSEPIALEVNHGASEDKYTTLFKAAHGTTVGSVATNVALISGFKALDITVDASLPFAVVKALSFRATKTAEGTVTLIFSKNQMVLAKLHYIMVSLTAHTLSLECPSRTIEFFVGFSGNEMTFKVFPEKNLSPKMIEIVLRVITKAAAIHMECLVTAPSLPKEMRIAAEFSLADPTMERKLNVDIHFPTTECKTLFNAILVELKKVYRDFVKDGVFPDMAVVYKELNLVLKELPKYLNILKMQVTNILTKYWTIVKNWAVTMWKNYEADIIAFVKTAHTEVLRYLEILKIEVPISVNEYINILKKTELWKKLHGMVNQIIEHFPVQYNILLDFYNNVIVATVTGIKDLAYKVVKLPSFGFESVWKLLVNELPTLFTTIKEQLLNSELVNVIIKKYTDVKALYPSVHAEIAELWTGVIYPVYKDVVTIFKKLMNIDFTNMSLVVDHLLKEIPALCNTIVTRLMGTKIVHTFITMVKEFIAANPLIIAVYEAAIEVVQNIVTALLGDLAMFYEKLMNITMFKKVVEWVQHIFNTKNFNMEFSYKTVAATVHSFVTEIIGVTIAGDHFSCVVTLPVSMSTITHTWTTVTVHLHAFVAELINALSVFTEKLPVFVTTLKKQVIVYVKFVAEQIPVIIRTVETHFPKFINEVIPVFNNFVEFVMNTKVFKFLMAKIEEVIMMYPTHFNVMKEYFERFFELAINMTTLVYAKMMDIPIIRRIVEYVWDIINRKDIYTIMISSWNSVSNYATSVSSNVPLFVKMHTPSVVSSWLSYLIQ